MLMYKQCCVLAQMPISHTEMVYLITHLNKIVLCMNSYWSLVELNLRLVLCFLMCSPLRINAIKMVCLLYMLRGHRTEFPNYDVFLSLKIVMVSANSIDPDEMTRYVAFHLGLYCLPKYPFMGFQNTKG